MFPCNCRVQSNGGDKQQLDIGAFGHTVGPYCRSCAEITAMRYPRAGLSNEGTCSRSWAMFHRFFVEIRISSGTFIDAAAFRLTCVNRRGPATIVTHRADEYRRLARECLELAATVATEQARRALREMATVWTRLAFEQDRPVSPGLTDAPQPVCQQQQQQQQLQPKERDEEKR